MPLEERATVFNNKSKFNTRRPKRGKRTAERTIILQSLIYTAPLIDKEQNTGDQLTPTQTTDQQTEI